MALPALAEAVRRFPLLGRPRPACPPLPVRIREVIQNVEAAQDDEDTSQVNAAHALNKAALIASDSGMTGYARDLCLQHIDAYCDLTRPLRISEARFLLEPVLNLARLHLRAHRTSEAIQLLDQMYTAVTHHHDLTVDSRTLPLGRLVGEHHERRQLLEWVWLQLVSEGVRAYALASRWDEAARHADRHKGIGVHLMEGRQAAIIASCMANSFAAANALLAKTTPTQPWEREISACLQLMTTEPDDPRLLRHIKSATIHYTERPATPGYHSYRVRLGLTIATLAHPTQPELANELINRVVEDALDSADGYAARDAHSLRTFNEGISSDQHSRLRRLMTDSGLGVRSLPDTTHHELKKAATEAAATLRIALVSAS
ncbi:hypothetical protein JIG36_48800 [Actinoplanes sp. LDG1-06]|uniref:XRE family transcriptional regulator n=1 Tax=Paractinoplanes ovalisporus TaxID=2810368 RepID=A0ABS2AU65_9ACTN|nr:hypothetical protein [Actinoplanes ovalisporus]MBM2623422.1 hypothetical protein [Actinoplanes ovalisporus]